jgi:hypothetical protein
MQNKIEIGAGMNRCFPRTGQTVAPSLRLAATARNRALLRWLRAAELTAWQDADTRRPVAARRVSLPARRQPFFRLNNR